MKNKPDKDKILIIEDDTNLLYSLQAKFSAEGFLVDSNQGNGSIEEMTNMVQLVKPGYIILDLLLPSLDGFELLQAIKANPETNRIPVFIFTNLSDKESKEKSDQLGADQFFLKSDFILDDFVTKISKIISNKKK